MVKNNIRTLSLLNKLQDQEKKLKKELAKTFLDYLDSLPVNKRIEQMESLLHGAYHKNLPTLDRRLTPQENKCLYLASKGKEIKEMARILGLSQRTIKFHRANITKKLEVPNLTAAVTTTLDIHNNPNQSKFDISCNFQMLSRSIIGKMPGINYLPVNIFILDKDGYLIWGNSRMIKTLNESEDSLIGKHVSYWGEDKWKACEKVLREENEEVLEEVGIDKRLYLTNRISIKEKIDNKIIQGVIGASLDITGQRKFLS